MGVEEKAARTVVWEAILLGRRLFAVTSIVVGAGWTGSKFVRSMNETEPPQAEKNLEAILNESSSNAHDGLNGSNGSTSMSSRSQVRGGSGWTPPKPPPRVTNPFAGNNIVGTSAATSYDSSSNESPPPAPTSPPMAENFPGAPVAPTSNGAFGNPAGAFPNGDQRNPATLQKPTDASAIAGAPGATPTSGSSSSSGGFAAGGSYSATPTPSPTPIYSSGSGSTTTTVNANNVSLVVTALPTTAASGVAFTTSPSFSAEYNSTQSIATGFNSRASLTAFMNNTCSTAADGTLSGPTTSVSLTSGVVRFPGLLYTAPIHAEELIYLKAATTTISGCSTSLPVLQRFNAGSGYVSPSLTAAGFAGAGSGVRKNSPFAVDRDSAGRYYVGGSSLNPAGGTELFVARYFADGVLDASFGSSGVFLYQNNGVGPAGVAAGARVDKVLGLKLNSSGLVIAIGTTADAAGGTDIFALRLTSSGALDTNFAATGLVVFGAGGAGFAGGLAAGKDDEVSSMNALVIDTLGRYVFPISSENAAGGHEAGLLAITSAGILDATFGTGGFVLLAHGLAGPTGAAAGSRDESPSALQVDNTGNLVTAFSVRTPAASRDAMIARFTYTGSLDTTFVTTGFTTLHSALGASVPSQIHVLGSGMIVGVEKIGTVLALFRLSSVGAPDATFGGSGLVVYNSSGPSAGGNAAAYDLPADFAVDATTGAYRIVGTTMNASGVMQLSQWRYLSSGALDSGFGTGGVLVFTNSGVDLAGSSSGSGDFASGHAFFDTYQRALVPVQTINTNGLTDFGLIRFLSTGAADK